MTAAHTLPRLSTLPSAQWERVRDGITDLDPVLDSILVWIKNEWLPAQIDRATTRYVTAAVYPWAIGADEQTVHVDDIPVDERPEPIRDHFRAPVAHVARRHRDRGGPGRPPIGPKIGPYPVPPRMRDMIVAFERAGGYESQAAAVRDLLQIGLAGGWPLPVALRARVEAYMAAEQFDTVEETIRFLLDDALTAANY
jgi:hypothetical protein